LVADENTFCMLYDKDSCFVGLAIHGDVLENRLAQKMRRVESEEQGAAMLKAQCEKSKSSKLFALSLLASLT
jgi:hypothetical protein